ncbi:MAG: imidazole glycerol phosphate synthase subunit HisH [Chitinophagales bacterium]|nr:imidazole glycerol phosphate synthase subunit HisH [Chitinophagales bacterium]
MQITIVDYKMGNLGSIQNMLKKLGYKSIVSSDLQCIEDAEKLILPGVGAFDNGMNNIRTLGLEGILKKKILEDKTPILGICLGMQLMTQGSEEGIQKGLGWINARVEKFNFKENNENLRIPHMGWNYTTCLRESALWREMPDETRFYYVHSYCLKDIHVAHALLTADYGGNFCSGFEQGNILGVQFHPEKSHKFGKQLLKNFITNY